MRLILIRHGQTACNITDIWHGWDDCNLTDLGIRQAQAVSGRLAAEPIAAIHASDLNRAMETARIVAQPHGLDPVPDPAYRERSAGDFQGSTFDEIVAARPAVLHDRAADYWGWSPPNGESFRVVLDRVLTGINRLRLDHAGETVAVVGHMGTVRVLIAHFLNISLDETYDMDFPSTGVSIFRVGDSAAQVELLNDAAHLPVELV